MNKVIVKRNEKVEEDSKPTTKLRRLNAMFDPSIEEDISHSGVLGMRWGVRKSKDSSVLDLRSAHQKKLDEKKAATKDGLVLDLRSVHQKKLDEKKAALLVKAEEQSLNKAANKAMSLANKKYLNIYNKMAHDSGEFYAEINSREKYKKLDLFERPNSKIAHEYYKDCADAATKSLQKHSDNILGPKVDSRLKVTWTMPENLGSMPVFYIEKADGVKHADIDEDRIKLNVTFDEKTGLIVKLDIPKDLFNDEDLEHSGVKGMKWGVRKSKDGGTNTSGFTLNKKTPVGKIVTAAKKVKDFYEKPDRDFAEATKGMSKVKALAIEAALGPYWGAKAINSAKAKAATPEGKARAAAKAAKKKAFDDEYNKEIAEYAKEKAAKAAEKAVIAERKALSKNRRTMSDEALNKAANRIQLEKKVKGLVDADVAPGQTAAKNILGKVGNATLMAAAGAVGGAIVAKAIKAKP